jgi:hypothetical protein
MVSKTELEALRQAYPDLPWPAECDSAAQRVVGGDAPQRTGGAALEARPALARTPR